MRTALIAAAALLGACSGDGPVLDSVTPTSGGAGTVVTLRGSRLCGTRAVGADGTCQPLPAGYVSFGIDPQIDGVVNAWSDTEIEAVEPGGVAAGDILIVVTVDGRSSNGVSFRVP